MRVLVIGSGGREHAIVWKLRQSKKFTAIFCAPGNPGISKLAAIVPLKVDDLDGLVAFAQKEKIDLTIVGPEYPLSLGLADKFRAKGLRVFGPSQAAAKLESSKAFAKEIMQAAGVPTASAEVFSDEASLRKYLTAHPKPIVLKADGLAAGKGVFVCKSGTEALAAVPSLFGELKSTRVVAEQFLDGVEVSYIIATDGETVIPFASSHDYKRIGDGDEGPNTGGMGTVSPTPRLTETQASWAMDHVIKPVVAEMKKRGTTFCGFLYAGLMISKDGTINVLEFNARMGDPECQSILRRMDSDLLEVLATLSEGPGAGKQLPPLAWKKESAVCVVLASDGYPNNPRSGDEITGIEFADMLPNCVVFHAGTKLSEQGKLLTSGGRVLNVTGTGATLDDARTNAYKACDMIQFKGRQLRRDIGKR